MLRVWMSFVDCLLWSLNRRMGNFRVAHCLRYLIVKCERILQRSEHDAYSEIVSLCFPALSFRQLRLQIPHSVP